MKVGTPTIMPHPEESKNRFYDTILIIQSFRNFCVIAEGCAVAPKHGNWMMTGCSLFCFSRQSPLSDRTICVFSVFSLPLHLLLYKTIS